MMSMSSEHQEVRDLLYELAKKIKSSHTEFTGKFISMSLHGMKSMSSDHEEVRVVLNELTKKINESDADIIGYGTHSLTYSLTHLTTYSLTQGLVWH
jgi:hemerythrin-like domain-containing protein